MDFYDADEEAAWAENIASTSDQPSEEEAPILEMNMSNIGIEATVPQNHKIKRRGKAQSSVQVEKMKPLKKHHSIDQNQIFSRSVPEEPEDNDRPGTPRF